MLPQKSFFVLPMYRTGQGLVLGGGSEGEVAGVGQQLLRLHQPVDLVLGGLLFILGAGLSQRHGYRCRSPSALARMGLVDDDGELAPRRAVLTQVQRFGGVGLGGMQEGGELGQVYAVLPVVVLRVSAYPARAVAGGHSRTAPPCGGSQAAPVSAVQMRRSSPFSLVSVVILLPLLLGTGLSPASRRSPALRSGLRSTPRRSRGCGPPRESRRPSTTTESAG